MYHFYNGRSKGMKSLHSNLCYQFIYGKLSVAFSRIDLRTVHKIPYRELPYHANLSYCTIYLYMC